MDRFLPLFVPTVQISSVTFPELDRGNSDTLIACAQHMLCVLYTVGIIITCGNAVKPYHMSKQ